MSDSDVATVAAKMGQTLQENGFNFNFAPVLDVNVNPENPILGKLSAPFQMIQSVFRL